MDRSMGTVGRAQEGGSVEEEHRLRSRLRGLGPQQCFHSKEWFSPGVPFVFPLQSSSRAVGRGGGLASIWTSVAAGRYTCSYEFEPESGTDGRNSLLLFFTPQYPLLGRGTGLRGGPDSQFLPSPDLTQGASVLHSLQGLTCVTRTEAPPP